MALPSGFVLKVMESYALWERNGHFGTEEEFQNKMCSTNIYNELMEWYISKTAITQSGCRACFPITLLSQLMV